MTGTELFTQTDRDRLLANGLNSGNDHVPIVKLFTPDGSATWLISDMDPDDPDSLFGLCDLGSGFPEMGYVSLAELQGIRGHFGLPVEKDLHFVGSKPLSAYADDARINGRIIV